MEGGLGESIGGGVLQYKVRQGGDRHVCHVFGKPHCYTHWGSTIRTAINGQRGSSPCNGIGGLPC